jgi:hypothetical protein
VSGIFIYLLKSRSGIPCGNQYYILGLSWFFRRLYGEPFKMLQEGQEESNASLVLLEEVSIF